MALVELERNRVARTFGEVLVPQKIPVQKALVVRTALEDAVGVSWSFEVDRTDGSSTHPLRDLLADGWRVVRTCPMPSELDSCCLVILEHPAARAHEATIADLGAIDWDGESIPVTPLQDAEPAK